MFYKVASRLHRRRQRGQAMMEYVCLLNVFVAAWIISASAIAKFATTDLNQVNVGLAGELCGAVQLGTPVSSSGPTVTITLPSPSTAGDLLTASLGNASMGAPTGPAGWVDAVTQSQGGNGRQDIMYYPNNPGGISSVTFTVVGESSYMGGRLQEWNGVAKSAPLDATGTVLVSSSSTSTTVTTSASTTTSSDLAIATITDTTGGQTYTPGVGWTQIFQSPSGAAAGDYQRRVPMGFVSDTISYNSSTAESLGIIATFKMTSPC